MKCGERTYIFDNPVYVRSGYSIVGKMEGEGNFGEYFDKVLDNDLWGEKSYERAECKMHKEAVKGAMTKAGIEENELGLLLGGDLLNEIVGASFAARDFRCAYMGVYNACATFGEAMLLGSMFISSGFEKYVSCSTFFYGGKAVQISARARYAKDAYIAVDRHGRRLHDSLCREGRVQFKS